MVRKTRHKILYNKKEKEYGEFTHRKSHKWRVRARKEHALYTKDKLLTKVLPIARARSMWKEGAKEGEFKAPQISYNALLRLQDGMTDYLADIILKASLYAYAAKRITVNGEDIDKVIASERI